ncbi:hypothetical protein MJ588_18480 [Klebsiella pneumoniae]|nr:hypothetical protein MJ588_18480 [Klebsiella pneumoniae]
MLIKQEKDLGFDVVKITVPDGEKSLNAIDSLAASGWKSFVICTPDPKLGSAIVAKARGAMTRRWLQSMTSSSMRRANRWRAYRW